MNKDDLNKPSQHQNMGINQPGQPKQAPSQPGQQKQGQFGKNQQQQKPGQQDKRGF
ncbi:hypothetical protein [Legionella jordanis]|uniref:Uncharacterized protein n=1 Tax=Legionella jordanis TaxID=456 RepID=A0A0W0VBM2_9GAMM|nr:hypothetical protein [Legionella jordanis]KTD17505.1 hypothetical protein Ljor_1811 [Legionella jordanis]VEH13474.1 Uncharacterised protein [Legionella jordanis]